MLLKKKQVLKIPIRTLTGISKEFNINSASIYHAINKNQLDYILIDNKKVIVITYKTKRFIVKSRIKRKKLLDIENETILLIRRKKEHIQLLEKLDIHGR